MKANRGLRQLRQLNQQCQNQANDRPVMPSNRTRLSGRLAGMSNWESRAPRDRCEPPELPAASPSARFGADGNKRAITISRQGPVDTRRIDRRRGGDQRPLIAVLNGGKCMESVEPAEGRRASISRWKGVGDAEIIETAEQERNAPCSADTTTVPSPIPASARPAVPQAGGIAAANPLPEQPPGAVPKPRPERPRQ